MKHAPLIVIGLLAAATACSNDEGLCADSRDCEGGLACSAGECVDPRQVVFPQPQPDMPRTRDSGVVIVPVDDGRPPDPVDLGPDLPPSICAVDPFMPPACSPGEGEPNDTWLDAHAINSHDEDTGCSANGYLPLDRTIQSSLCASENDDYYEVRVRKCTDSGLLVRWTLTPSANCGVDILDVSVPIGSHDTEPCNEGDVTCTISEDGTVAIVQRIAPDRNNIFRTAYLRVSTGERRDIAVDYTLRVVVEREP